jgi:hypothetical protein
MAVAEGAIETASTSVVVSSLMADATSGMHQMSVDPGTGLFGGWIAYTADYTITLPSFPYGEKTVRVQYRDNAGNVSLRTDTITLVAPIGNATLAFIWHPSGSNSATLHVENSSGVTIAGPVTKSGGGTALDWSVTVPSGQNYRMVVDYYYDESNDDEGGPYSIWCNDLLNNRGEPMVTSGSMPGVLEPNETITWYY